jgi:NAD-dependent dihydropyrimidine dehydrogenase PreA subunit
VAVIIDIDKCEGCGDCVEVCPSEVLALVEVDGKEVAKAVNPDDCIDCGACEAECPEEAITLAD